MRPPVSDYVETNGVLFFARMLDKLRLKEQNELPADYNYAGCQEQYCFDAYCCRFFAIDPARLAERLRAGGSKEEILEWCFEIFRRPTADEIKFWNHFVTKCGWRDPSSAELEQAKRASGFGDRTDIQTWVDYHDADEGRELRKF